MTRDDILREIDRCDREIAAMEGQAPGAAAYLTTMGMEDWKRERAILEDMLGYRIAPKTGIKPFSSPQSEYKPRTNRETTRKWIRESRPRAS